MIYYNYVNEEKIGASINTSGKQRMLSQRIFVYYESYLDHKKSINENEYKDKLKSLLNEMRIAHDELINGSKNLVPALELDEAFKDIYFSNPHNLDKKLNKYIQTIEELLNNRNLNEAQEEEHLKNVFTQMESLLKSLDYATKQYQIVSEELVETSKLVLFFILIFYICILLFATKYIFFPLNDLIKTRESDLKKSKKFLSNIMESALDGIVTIDEKGVIETFNKAAQELFGYSKSEVIGKNVNILIPSPHKENHDQYIKNYLISGIPKAIGSTAELPARRKDGTIFPVALRIGEIKFDNRRIFTALIQDITQRKEHEKELVDAKERAEEATQAKSAFLANMSHEIRTPMNAIVGLSHLALKTNPNNKQRNYLNKISNSADSLLYIINDILDISKIEAGKLEIYKTTFNLFKLIEDIVHLIELKAKENNVNLVVEYDPNLGKNVYADSLRINQILTNLLTNAVKFTQKGEIKLIVRNIDENKVNFQVHDTGIGLTQEQISKIFQSFSQADISTTKKYGGTGLGLAISKQLVEMMNGKIWVESELGIGSKFIFDIELEKKDDIKKLNKFLNKKALVIDDCPSWTSVIKDLMNNFGVEVHCVDSGKKAIEVLKENTNEYDVILVDWKMPDLDGIDCCKIMKNELGIDSNKIVLVSVNSNESLEEAIKDTNINYYIHKPINPSLLNDILNEVFFGILSKKRVNIKNDINTLIENIKTLKGSNILLVEDNEVNQEIVCDLLNEGEINIDIANNGLESIKMFKENKNKYELILMDIQMPIMDGYEATKEIRLIDKNIPIIALTANAMKKDIENTELVGMNKHLNKPINVEKLYNTLLEFISKKVSIDEIRTTSKKDDSINISTIPTFKNFDSNYGLNLLLGNEKAYINILKGLLKYKDIDYTQLDNEELKRTAHSLKGLSASAGALDLSELARQIEESLDRRVISNLQEELYKIIDEIEEKLPKDEKIDKSIILQEQRDELFKQLKEALLTKRAKNCKPIIEEIEKYQLSQKDSEIFEQIKELTSKFKFKEAVGVLG